MNIFYLSRDPHECAVFHNNKHVVKMVLESAQLLSNAHHMLDGAQAITPIYKLTHKNHPSAVWVRSSKAHYQWLWCLLEQLCKEYTHRYKKIHKIERESLLDVLKQPPNNIPNIGWQCDPTPAMPNEYKVGDVVESYRGFYIGEKSHFSFWKERAVPAWFNK
jgi:hypothetical protein